MLIIIKREKIVWTDRQINRRTDAHYIFVWTDKFYPKMILKIGVFNQIPNIYPLKKNFAGPLLHEDSKNVFGLKVHL